jgi:putative acetyltransferase
VREHAVTGGAAGLRKIASVVIDDGSVPIAVRDQQPVDRAAVGAVLTDAFGARGAHVAALAEALLDGPARCALVAETAGKIVGSVLLSRSWLDAEAHLVDVLVLSPLGVATAHQRQGVGTELVRAALAAAESANAPLVFLEGSPDYYRRFGFVRGSTHGFSPPSARVPDRGFQVATLSAWRTWMTGALVYCDAFWQYDAVGLREAKD